jgi:HD-like signal output (HDOD) protein
MRNKIESISQSIILLGLPYIRNLVLCLLFDIKFSDKYIIANRILEQSRIIAACSAFIAKNITDIGADEAYMVGLFHNIGSLILAHKYPDSYDVIYENGKKNPSDITDDERRVYNIDHTTIGYSFAVDSHLPEFVIYTIYYHHISSCKEIDTPKIRALIAIIKIATDIVNRKLKDIPENDDHDYDTYTQNAINELMIDEDVIDDIDISDVIDNMMNSS